jgi:hypothetical protein
MEELSQQLYNEADAPTFAREYTPGKIRAVASETARRERIHLEPVHELRLLAHEDSVCNCPNDHRCRVRST